MECDILLIRQFGFNIYLGHRPVGALGGTEAPFCGIWIEIRLKVPEPSLEPPRPEHMEVSWMRWLLKTREVSGVTLVDILSAKVTLDETYRDLRLFINDLVVKGGNKILLNLANVNYIDSSGLGDLISCYTSALRKSAQLKLLRAQERVCDLLIATKLIGVFEIFSDEESALKSFQSDESS